MEKKELLGLVALVTGGTSGIGKETAKRFLEDGAKVVVAGRSEDAGAKTVEELSALGEIAYVRCDLSVDADVEALVPAVIERFGKIDILVNNAGMPNRSPIGSVTREEYDAMFAVHLKAGFFLSQAAAEYMKQQRFGRIVNVSSPRAILPDCQHPLYGICKAAVRTMTEYYAVGLSRWNIRTNAVSPALIYTPMTEHYRNDPTNIIAKMLVPGGEYQDVRAIVDSIEFLVSEKSSSINGQTLETDAGARLVNLLNVAQYELMKYPKSAHDADGGGVDLAALMGMFMHKGEKK